MVDIAFMIAAFQAMNKVIVAITLTAMDSDGAADMRLTATAHQLATVDPEAPILVSVSKSFLGMNIRTLEAAVIQLLYQLDFALAEKELGRMAKN